MITELNEYIAMINDTDQNVNSNENDEYQIEGNVEGWFKKAKGQDLIKSQIVMRMKKKICLMVNHAINKRISMLMNLLNYLEFPVKLIQIFKKTIICINQEQLITEI